MPFSAGVRQRAELAVEAADAEPARHADRVDVVEHPVGARLLGALVGGDPADVHLGVVGEATGVEGLGDREVGVVQVDVLADERDGDVLLGVVHLAQQVVPGRPVDVAERQVEPADEVGVEALAVQHLGDVVDRGRVGGGDHRLLVDVAHQRDLALDALGDLAVGAAHDRVGLDADGAERGHGVLGRLGLQLAGRADVRDERDVQEEAVVAADVVADLTGGLQERQRLDVADRAADLGDDHVDVGRAHRPDPVLDLVGDVRDHLDGVAEVVAAALLGDHARVDLPRRDVGDLAQVGVQEPLVVPDVEVGLGPVIGDEDLAVLERVHRPGVDVEVRVELLHGDPQTARTQQPTEGRGRQSLAQRGGDAPGHEHMLGGRLLHGVPSYPRGTGESAPDAPNDPPGVVSTCTSARMLATRPAAVSVPSTVATGRTGGCCAQPGDAGVGGRTGHHDALGDRREAGDDAVQHERLDVLAGDDEDQRRDVGLVVRESQQAGALEAGAERGHSGGVQRRRPLGRADRPADQLADPVVRRGVGRHDVARRAARRAGGRGCRRGSSRPGRPGRAGARRYRSPGYRPPGPPR